MKEYSISGDYPILVFDFLSRMVRMVDGSDILGLTEV